MYVAVTDVKHKFGDDTLSSSWKYSVETRLPLTTKTKWRCSFDIHCDMHVSVQMHMCNDGTAIFPETHGVVNNKVPAVAVAISHHHLLYPRY